MTATHDASLGMANLAPRWARNRAMPKQPERNRWIVGLRRDGLSFGAIADKVDVSRNTVAGVCWRAGLCTPKAADGEAAP